jgi:hypothetical protein
MAGLEMECKAGRLHLQLRHHASAIVADSNISYGQMLLSRDAGHILTYYIVSH